MKKWEREAEAAYKKEKRQARKFKREKALRAQAPSRCSKCGGIELTPFAHYNRCP